MPSPRTYDALGAYMVVSAIVDAIQPPFIRKALDTVEFPPRYRWIFSPIKAAAAVGLFSMRWFPGPAQLTTAMLTLFFVLAVGSHITVRDLSPAVFAAAANAAVFAVATAEGPTSD
jgi:DoxX-like family